MTIYFLVDDNNLVANMAEYPEGREVPREVLTGWLSKEQTATAIDGKVYNSSDQTFSDPTEDLIGVEPVSQLT